MNKDKLLHEIIESYPALKYELLDALSFDESHFGFKEICYQIMETDQVRVNAFRQGFAKYNFFKNKIICEAGVGRLALSQHYLPFVKKAYLIENNPDIIPYIRKALKEKGWENKVEFIVGNAMEIVLPEKVDFVVGELMSIYCVDEYQVEIFKNLRKYLKPNGKLIPEKVINTIAISHAKFEQKYKHYPLMFTRHYPALLSIFKKVNTTNLYKVSALKVEKQLNVKCLLSGMVNCVSLRSLVQISEGINFTGTDSLMPPTVVKLEKPVKVSAGETVKLNVLFEYGKTLDDARFEIVK